MILISSNIRWIILKGALAYKKDTNVINEFLKKIIEEAEQ